MMSETTDDMSPDLDGAPKETDSGDNGSLRQSGFVLVSGSGAEVANLRQSSPASGPGGTAATAATAAAAAQLTQEFPNLTVAGSPPPSRETSISPSQSPPRNPYRGLSHLQHAHGHGHSHEHGADHCHEASPPPPPSFFTPSAPAADAPLPPTLTPPPQPQPPAIPVAPSVGPPLPQYQLPQFERPAVPMGAPMVAPIPREVAAYGSQDTYVGMGDVGVVSHTPAVAVGGTGGGGGSGGFLSNFFGSDLVHKVVEKTKSGVETVITTLDPGMKEYIMAGGELCLIIASVDEQESLAIRDAFYSVFGKATIRCLASPSDSNAHLIGPEAARQSCQQRIAAIRTSGQAPPDAAVIAASSFLSEQTPGRWFAVEYLLIQDNAGPNSVECDGYSLALPIGSEQQQQVQHFMDWRQARFGLTRRDLVAQTARIVAREYKQRTRGPESPIAALPFTS